jgi:predicted nucleotidyltransferase component of viral defense system
MQLKAYIKKKAAEKDISAQLVMQNYMMERLLERISLSKYKANFILKGGFLIAAIVGLDTRTTMDLDATIKGFTLTHESIREIFEDICNIKVEDDVTFSILRITDIRETDDYPGIRVSLSASYPPLNVPLTVDLTTGDKITPCEIEYTFRLLFEERSISILAYNLETILAEKLETVLSRNIANTRPRDFYDICVLFMLRGSECKLEILKNALEETAKKRGSLSVLPQYESIVDSIKSSSGMRDFWARYQKEFDYAKDITFDDTCNMILQIMDNIAANR